MRLADFVLNNIEPVLTEWVILARTMTPEKDIFVLRDRAEEILRAAVVGMHASQTSQQHSAKPRNDGRAGKEGVGLDSAPEDHAVGKANSGFDMMELISEYRALRVSVVRLWRDSVPDPVWHDLDDLTRFNEAIDQSVATAVHAYTDQLDETREIFLAILGHDLRNPLAALKLGAYVLSQNEDLDANAAKLADEMMGTTSQMDALIMDILDFSVIRLGHGIPVTITEMNLEALCRNSVAEMQTAHPLRILRCTARGNIDGTWDARRLWQVISNLLANAIQYGAYDMPVELSVTGEASDVVINVHNDGDPIPPARVTSLFHPMSRRRYNGIVNRPGSIRLGLYIVREIVTAHAGTVQVTSSLEAGTDVTVRLPRKPAPTRYN